MGPDLVAPGSPGGEVEQLTDMFHPANSTLTIAKALRSQVEAFGLLFSPEGTSRDSVPFSWAT